MPEFLVRFHQPHTGVQVRRVTAAQPQGVAEVLAVSPLQVLSVEPVIDSPAQRRAWGTSRGFALRPFCQELAVLLDAGIPLLEALTTLQEKQGQASAVAHVLAPLVEVLRQGLPLSQAMRASSHNFGPLLLAIVAASERTGQLSIGLREHARYLAWSEGLRRQLVGAAIYPTLLVAAGTLVVAFLVLYVLPRFAGLLEGSAADLPWASRALIDTGAWLAERPLALAAGPLALGLLALLAQRQPRLRAGLLALPWHLPGLGPRLATLALARLYRTLGMLLGAGVPLVPALDLLQGVAATRHADALSSLRADISAGQRLSDALDHHGLATPVARRMVRVGERSGELASMLERAAAFHDEEMQQLADFVTRALNPLLMLLMGLSIGGIVVLMYLPVFSLVESVQ